MAHAESTHYIAAVRRFNRFYTKQIGLLQEHYLQSGFPLAEVRVIYELGQRESATASALATELGLDPGYLSRIVQRLQQRGLLQKTRSPDDGRQSLLALTKQGRSAYTNFDTRSQDAIGELLTTLAPADRKRLVAAMQTIENLLGVAPQPKIPYLLRPHQPGDMGWIIHRHGVIYAEEYGWDESFEALVAGVAADFIKHFEARYERCWMAEMEGEIVGSVLLVKKSEKVAQLRLLIVEPKARGLGIGKRLVEECERFARRAGYQKITLWTNHNLTAARAIYKQAGYRLVATESHHSFGHDLIGETWELDL